MLNVAKGDDLTSPLWRSSRVISVRWEVFGDKRLLEVYIWRRGPSEGSHTVGVIGASQTIFFSFHSSLYLCLIIDLALFASWHGVYLCCLFFFPTITTEKGRVEAARVFPLRVIRLEVKRM
jgi:hypothetical protein